MHIEPAVLCEDAAMLKTLAEWLDRRFGWGRLPYLLGLFTLVGLRDRLRERNLYDTGVPVVRDAPGDLNQRRPDGYFNDVGTPGMGGIEAPFGRNAPSLPNDPERSPTAREISQALFTRHTFLPASHLNVIAAAWLQFEVHDWVMHDKSASDWDLGDGMPLSKVASVDGRTFVSHETHWWDASQLYGTRDPFLSAVRADGGELVVDDALLEAYERAATGPNTSEANMWVGLALLSIVFAREHNAIVRALRAAHSFSDDELYAKARLINSALMAKIHTVEWTPAIIGHPTTEKAIVATWYGLLGRAGHRRFGRVGKREILSGIPGSRTDHHGVPYSLTEEFVTVYRLHPLMPDEFTLGDEVLTLRDLALQPGKIDQPRRRIHEAGGAAAAWQALGTQPPGQIELHNYPRTMQSWERIGGLPPIDLAAADIIRARETGVAPYNAFRRLLRMPPAASFEELAGGNELHAREIRELYAGDLEAVDAVVGLYGEPKPRGFAFSETAFRIFLLMASRRLQSDRFFTADYTPEVYTPEGLQWIEETSMADILRRHYPSLRPAENAFTNWGASR
jgi:hypothetical protein